MLLALEPPRGGVNDPCARGGDTKRRASRLRWSQPCITAVMWGPRRTKPCGTEEDHRGGGGRARDALRPTGTDAPASRDAASQPGYRSEHKSESRGTPWSSLANSLPRCRSSMILCRACRTWCGAAGGTVGGCASSGVDRADTPTETWRARVWCRIAAYGDHQGVFWWQLGTQHYQCLSPPGITASPGRYRNTGEVDVFYEPLYLAVTCLATCLPEEYLRGLFWEMTSGGIPYSAAFGSTVAYMVCQFAELQFNWASSARCRVASGPRCRWQFRGNCLARVTKNSSCSSPMSRSFSSPY